MEQQDTSQYSMQPPFDFSTINPLAVLRLVRSAGGAFIAQAALHGQLASIEFAEEKNRILKMTMVTLLGFSSLICLMLFIGISALALSWETVYRIPTIVLMIVLYVMGISLSWNRFQGLADLGGQAFAATREEMAADIALIKSKL